MENEYQSPVELIPDQFEEPSGNQRLFRGANYDIDKIYQTAQELFAGYVEDEGFSNKQSRYFAESVKKMLNGLANQTITPVDFLDFDVTQYNQNTNDPHEQLSDNNKVRRFAYDREAAKFLNWVIKKVGKTNPVQKKIRRVNVTNELDSYLKQLGYGPEQLLALEQPIYDDKGTPLGYSMENRIKFLKNNLQGFSSWLKNKYKNENLDLPEDFDDRISWAMGELNKKLRDHRIYDLSQTPWDELFTIGQRLSINAAFVQNLLQNYYKPVIPNPSEPANDGTQKDPPVNNNEYNGNLSVRINPLATSTSQSGQTLLLNRIYRKFPNQEHNKTKSMVEYGQAILDSLSNRAFNSATFNELVSPEDPINLGGTTQIPYSRHLAGGLDFIFTHSAIRNELTNSKGIIPIKSGNYNGWFAIRTSYDEYDNSVIIYNPQSKQLSKINASKCPGLKERIFGVKSQKKGGIFKFLPGGTTPELTEDVTSQDDLDTWMHMMFPIGNLEVPESFKVHPTISNTNWSTGKNQLSIDNRESDRIGTRTLSDGSTQTYPILDFKDIYDTSRKHASTDVSQDAITFLTELANQNSGHDTQWFVDRYNKLVSNLRRDQYAKFDYNDWTLDGNQTGWSYYNQTWNKLYRSFSKDFDYSSDQEDILGFHTLRRSPLTFLNDDDNSKYRTFDFNGSRIHFKNDGTLEIVQAKVDNVPKEEITPKPAVDENGAKSLITPPGNGEYTPKLFNVPYNRIQPIITGVHNALQGVGSMAAAVMGYNAYDPSLYRVTPERETALFYGGINQDVAKTVNANNLQTVTSQFIADPSLNAGAIRQTVSDNGKRILEAEQNDRQIAIDRSDKVRAAATKTYNNEVSAFNTNAKLAATEHQGKVAAKQKLISDLWNAGLKTVAKNTDELLKRYSKGFDYEAQALETALRNYYFTPEDEEAIKAYNAWLADDSNSNLTIDDYLKTEEGKNFAPVYEKYRNYNIAYLNALNRLRSGLSYGSDLNLWSYNHYNSKRRHLKKGGRLTEAEAASKDVDRREKRKLKKKELVQKNRKAKDDRFSKSQNNLSAHAASLTQNALK